MEQKTTVTPWKFELDEIVDHVETCSREKLSLAMHEYFHGPSPRYSEARAAEGKLYLAELVACVLTGARSRGLMAIGVEEFRTEAYGILLRTDDTETLERELTALFLRIVDRVEPIHSKKISLIVVKALNAAERQYSDPKFDLQVVAETLGVTAGYLGRRICRETGTRYSEYLTRIRMSVAVRILRRETVRTAELARMVGYEDPHYFSRLFRAHTGMTPREMREGFLSRLKNGETDVSEQDT